MASKYWIKLYHEILDDPKMGMLPDRLYRRTIELFLMAGELNEDGRLPDVKSIAWRLRVNENDMLEELQALQAVSIVTLQDDCWVVTKFCERQSPVSDAERMKLLRDRKQKDEYYCHESVTNLSQNVTETVTNRNADIDTDIDTESDIESDTESDAKKNSATDSLFTRYEREIGAITPLIAEKIKDLATAYPEAWISDAMWLAVQKNARNLSYVEAILKRWKAEGKDNGKRAGGVKGPPVRSAEDYKKAWGKA